MLLAFGASVFSLALMATFGLYCALECQKKCHEYDALKTKYESSFFVNNQNLGDGKYVIAVRPQTRYTTCKNWVIAERPQRGGWVIVDLPSLPQLDYFHIKNGIIELPA